MLEDSLDLRLQPDLLHDAHHLSRELPQYGDQLLVVFELSEFGLKTYQSLIERDPHALFNLPQPEFWRHFGRDLLKEVDDFSVLRLESDDNVVTKDEAANALEQLPEEDLQVGGVLEVSHQLDQLVVAGEVETGELCSFLVEILGQTLIEVLDPFLHAADGLGHTLGPNELLHGIDSIGGQRFSHHFPEVLLEFLEYTALSFERQGNLFLRVNRLKVLPASLDLKPVFECCLLLE